MMVGKWFLLVLLCLPLVLADDAIFKTGDMIDLKVPCFRDDAYCSASGICNVTIVNPDGGLFIDDAVMTNSGTFFNYTLSSDNTSVVGVYKLQVTCFDGGEAGYSLIEFKITSSGMEGIIEDSLVPALILIVLLLFCAFMAWRLPDEEYGLKILFLGFALFLMILMIRFANLVSGGDAVNVTNLLNTAFWAFVPVLIFILFYYVVVKFLFERVLGKFVKEYKDRKEGKDDGY